MKQKKLVLLASVIVIMVIIGWLIIDRSNNSTKTNNTATPQQQDSKTGEGSHTGKRICPDAWYDNQMPRPAEDAGKPSQYFIISGQRVELNELDVEWVKANCIVNEPHLVQ